jgi:hypothetical protein
VPALRICGRLRARQTVSSRQTGGAGPHRPYSNRAPGSTAWSVVRTSSPSSPNACHSAPPRGISAVRREQQGRSTGSRLIGTARPEESGARDSLMGSSSIVRALAGVDGGDQERLASQRRNSDALLCGCRSSVTTTADRGLVDSLLAFSRDFPWELLTEKRYVEHFCTFSCHRRDSTVVKPPQAS